MATNSSVRAHPAVRLRRIAPHAVAYTLVGPREWIGLHVPSLLKTSCIKNTADLPKSGFQLHNPQWYQRYHLERNQPQPVRFGVIYDINLPELVDQFFNEPALIHVVCCVTQDPKAIAAIATIKAPKIVVAAIEGVEKLLVTAGVPHVQIAVSTADVLTRIEAEAKLMKSGHGADYNVVKTHNGKIADEWRNKAFPGKQRPFFPIDVNRSQIRQLLGEYRPNFWQYEKETRLEPRPAAQVEMFNAVTNTIQAIVASEDMDPKWAWRLPTAILAFPSLSPLLKDLLTSSSKRFGKEKSLFKELTAILLAEQNTSTYRSEFSPKAKNPDDLSRAIEIAKSELGAYTHFFDDMGYLHGSFLNSPYMRAPLKGKSLSQYHSYFSPRNFSSTTREATVLRKIRTFSDALTVAIDKEMIQTLTRYPECILGLSDLPIEWLNNGGVPWCFSHDVCRIPETVPTNMLSQFAFNRFSAFEIDSRITANTLIVCGAHKDDLVEKAFSNLREFWTERKAPWKWAHCTTLEDLYTAVWHHRPQLLIFDTHGRFTENATGTELQFGDEFLDGRKVIEKLPQVPLVILSSCWGAPLYGCPNTIAHAFFEGGSFAVTCSMLPLGVLKGASLYSRVLNNLQYVGETPIHNTWASFMSHNLRTSYFDDLKERIQRRHPDGLLESEKYVARRAAWQGETMNFSTRGNAFREAQQSVVECFKPELAEVVKRTLAAEEFVPEFMFYTTMGRADLVRFANWDSRYSKPKDELPTISKLSAELENSTELQIQPVPGHSSVAPTTDGGVTS